MQIIIIYYLNLFHISVTIDFLGRLVDPKEACDWGLVNRVVATGTAFGQAFNMAKVRPYLLMQCYRKVEDIGLLIALVLIVF